MEQSPQIRSIGRARERSRRVARAAQARRTLTGAPSRTRRQHGRAWLNGVELGTSAGRLTYLSDSYD